MVARYASVLNPTLDFYLDQLRPPQPGRFTTMKKKPTKKPKKKLSMAKRVDRVMLKAAQAGNLRQVGDHWHFGGITKVSFASKKQ